MDLIKELPSKKRDTKTNLQGLRKRSKDSIAWANYKEKSFF